MSGNRIARTKTIDGLVTPVFIHNGPSYFFINLEVYADGLVNCWELVDLASFKEKQKVGWVTTAVPDGEEIHVHGLGSWTITTGSWPQTAKHLFTRVNDLVRELNPRMDNLQKSPGKMVEKVNGLDVTIQEMVRQHPVRMSEPGPFAKRIKGDAVSVFVHVDDKHYLADLRAFADGVVELGRLPKAETLDVPTLKAAVEQGRILSAPAPGTRIEIHGLGSFAVAEEQWSTEIEDVLRGVPDLIDAANNRPDSVDRCRVAYEAYLVEPTLASREALRVSYEAVPAHKRMYVGDMDTKDVAVRMILYGDEEIESWSHRLVARAHGEPLPTITVPKPKDE